MDASARARLRTALKPRESAAENEFVKRARAEGWRTKKMNGLGQRDWPDQLVLLRRRRIALIEFKRPGEPLRPGQADMFKEFETLAHVVFVAYSADEAMRYCRKVENG